MAGFRGILVKMRERRRYHPSAADKLPDETLEINRSCIGL